MLRTATLLTLLSAGLAYGQASVDVTLYDYNTRAPLPGLTVTLVNESIGFEDTAVTDDAGQARWAGLSTAGEYVVSVPAGGGYLDQATRPLTLRSRANRSVSLLLIPVQTVDLEGVEVTGETGFADLNRVNAEVSATLSAREVQALPVEGRDLTRVLFRLPGVTQATGFFPEAPSVSINGANGLFVNYLIDGLDNNEQFLGGQRFQMPVGFVQDVTALTGAFSAEYGRTNNGVFNVTTRGGGNTIEGEVFYLTRPGSIVDGSSDFNQRDLLGNEVKDGFSRQQFGIAAGGPLVRDRTFLFVNLEQTFDAKDNLLTSEPLGVRETVEGSNRFTYASARLDHVWSSRLRSNLRVNVGLVGNERQAGGLEGGVAFPSAANTQTRQSLNVALQNTARVGRAVVESHYQYAQFDWDYASPEANGPQVLVLDPQGQAAALIGDPGYVFREQQHTFQTQQKLTLPLGRHTLKAGLDAITTDHTLTGGGNPDGNYTVQLTDEQFGRIRSLGTRLSPADIPGDAAVLAYNVETRPGSFGARQNLFAAYVEDQFAPTADLTLTAGLRYDVDNLSRGGGDDLDLNNLAPRLSANYALDARTNVRGGYGIYYDRVNYALYSDALQFSSTSDGFRGQLRGLIDAGILPSDTDLDAITFDGNQSASFSGIAYGEGPTVDQIATSRQAIQTEERRILNPNGYDNPYAHQFALGVQRQLDSRTLFFADAVVSLGRSLFRLRDLNAPSTYVVGLNPDGTPDRAPRSVSDADLTRPVPIRTNEAGQFVDAGGNVIDGATRKILVSESGGESFYRALTLNLVREPGLGDPFSYRLSYTLSRLENDTEDINFRAQNSGAFDDEWGPSVNDRTHVLNGLLYYAPRPWLTLSLASLLQSGQPINRVPDALLLGTTDLNGDNDARGRVTQYGGGTDRAPGESRNSDRLPWSTTFDVGAQIGIPVGGRTLVFRADVFNVFNAENLSGYANNASRSNQIQVGSASSGVLVQRNAAPPRQFQFGLTFEL
jgi:outer membrane receptor protein involved in Fe transport